MKQFIFFCLALFCAAALDAQVQHRVNNTGVSAEYNDLEDAIEDNPAGHTYVVEGSDFDYGQVQVDKKATVYGPGYFLDENLAYDTIQGDTRASELLDLKMQDDSDNSFIQGLTIRDLKIQSGANNITISRCRITGFIDVQENVTNLTIIQCYIESEENQGVLVYLKQATNVVMSNNVIMANNPDNGSHCVLMEEDGGSGVFRNNIFFGQPKNTFKNATVQNNYFYESVIDHNESSNLVVDHNISNDLFLNTYYGGTSNFNLADTDYLPDSIVDFMNAPSPDHMFELRDVPTNPAIGGGTGGDDMGPYDGDYPYEPSGLPSIPRVWFFNPTGVATPGGSFPAQVKAKAGDPLITPMPDVISMEYFFGADPGYNNATQFVFPQSGPVFIGTSVFAVPGVIPNSFHRIYYRAKDENGDYGLTQRAWVYVSNISYLIADMNDDGVVNVTDMIIFFTEMGCVADPMEGEVCNSDFNGDNMVTTADLLLFMSYFGLPGQSPPG